MRGLYACRFGFIVLSRKALVPGWFRMIFHPLETVHDLTMYKQG